MKAQATILGFLGKDPERREISTGVMAILSVATHAKFKGEKVTLWHKVRIFGKQAEVALRYLKKGDPIDIVGDMAYEEYTAKDGTKVKAAVIVSRTMTFANGITPAKEERNTPQPTASSDPFGDDDIPF